VRPRGDQPAKLEVTDEKSNGKSLGTGIQNIGPTPAGKVEAQIESNNRISYQRTMHSWREGLSYEQFRPREYRAQRHRPINDVTRILQINTVPD